MARPRKVRTPEEQRTYVERRRQQRRESDRRRRAANTTGEERAKNTERMRQVRQDAQRREAENASQRRRYHAATLHNFKGAYAEFKRYFLDRQYRCSCRVCGRLRSESDLTTIGNVRDPAKRTRALQVLADTFPDAGDMANFRVCGTCKGSLLKGAAPRFPTTNGNADPVVPRTARCVVPVCHSRSAPSYLLYPLPAEPSQRQAWIDFVRGCPFGGVCDWNPPTNEISLVCSLHFTVRCFRFQRPRGCSVGYRKCLRKGAVPTLYPIEEQGSSMANKNSPGNTAETLASSDVEDPEGKTRNSLASSLSVAGQDRGHCASDQDAVRRVACLAAFELIFPKDVSTQCSVEMASKAASCVARTASKSVQCTV
ncbi:uncharacterized protein [Dermacentor andersoni]|uniref:uncharacterized protein isoform X2 n=1 Tax=Dermacentor andersoni TaxID=34620 RepID=UPI0021552412|nr:uncharacterized protein LOC126526729 isoform X2 [Dermacentor andersoni]